MLLYGSIVAGHYHRSSETWMLADRDYLIDTKMDHLSIRHALRHFYRPAAKA